MKNNAIYWYPKFESQHWYENTYLVNNLNEIACNKDNESNSVFDSGCHFTCLAMIIGVNPAHLATLYKNKRLFEYNPSCELVWDCNKPYYCDVTIHLKNVYVGSLKYDKITVTLLKKTDISSIENIDRFILESRSKDEHLVFGGEDHSLLVAGRCCDKFVYWDPNSDFDSIENNFNGSQTIESFLEKHEKISFWHYNVECL
ncbi:hypothetical protein [Vibrio sp. WXL103]|uniref:hypothetical protein n=1 Tax=Vibrio sp. WXL103 TaxID=3450710 RepID=UPI003EC4EF7D